TELSLFAGEAPKKPTVEINILKASNDLLRRSSDAVAIPAATTRTLTEKNRPTSPSSSSNHSSGSSPAGCDHLFPGEQGRGINSGVRFEVLPIVRTEFAIRRQ